MQPEYCQPLLKSALLSKDSFIWLFHDKVYHQDVIIISLLEYRGYRNIPYYCKCIRTCKKIQSSYSVHEYKLLKQIRNTSMVINRPKMCCICLKSNAIYHFNPFIVLAPHELRNFEHFPLRRDQGMIKAIYFRIKIKSTNCKKCFERLIEQQLKR